MRKMPKKLSVKVPARGFPKAVEGVREYFQISGGQKEPFSNWTAEQAIILLYREFEKLMLAGIVGAINKVTTYFTNQGSAGWLSARKAFLSLGLFQCLARFDVCRLSAVYLGFRHGYDLLRKVAEAVKLGWFFAHKLLLTCRRWLRNSSIDSRAIAPCLERVRQIGGLVFRHGGVFVKYGCPSGGKMIIDCPFGKALASSTGMKFFLGCPSASQLNVPFVFWNKLNRWVVSISENHRNGVYLMLTSTSPDRTKFCGASRYPSLNDFLSPDRTLSTGFAEMHISPGRAP